ncbi:hypothetical protein HYH03_015881 [Edaphochlamys debaryana]|uniref:Uncharacterized protein n=1 Tax=Edaphochlamys debaryana TaxID=47281 RepID=A0A836BQQ9_9CHLO|nr:hypothetical protein HYH03_015881 [Edaphochlamys debaryana]|eukprot:KAG2485395.1 hypothetical protein HYH03_015881 [Edaphochlamys debaryana]
MASSRLTLAVFEVDSADGGPRPAAQLPAERFALLAAQRQTIAAQKARWAAEEARLEAQQRAEALEAEVWQLRRQLAEAAERSRAAEQGRVEAVAGLTQRAEAAEQALSAAVQRAEAAEARAAAAEQGRAKAEQRALVPLVPLEAEARPGGAAEERPAASADPAPHGIKAGARDGGPCRGGQAGEPACPQPRRRPTEDSLPAASAPGASACDGGGSAGGPAAKRLRLEQAGSPRAATGAEAAEATATVMGEGEEVEQAKGWEVGAGARAVPWQKEEEKGAAAVEGEEGAVETEEEEDGAGGRGGGGGGGGGGRGGGGGGGEGGGGGGGEEEEEEGAAAEEEEEEEAELQHWEGMGEEGLDVMGELEDDGSTEVLGELLDEEDEEEYGPVDGAEAAGAAGPSAPGRLPSALPTKPVPARRGGTDDTFRPARPTNLGPMWATFKPCPPTSFRFRSKVPHGRATPSFYPALASHFGIEKGDTEALPRYWALSFEEKKKKAERFISERGGIAAVRRQLSMPPDCSDWDVLEKVVILARGKAENTQQAARRRAGRPA